MFSDISIFNFLIYAAGVGFAVAIIYTNIQRTAFSKFINYLIDNNCNSEQRAVTLGDIGLSLFQSKVIMSAVKHQHGFKRSVSCICFELENSKTEEVFFDNTSKTKFYLCESDTETLKKKYTYKTMSTKLVALLIVSLVLVIILTSFFTGWLIKVITMPKMDNDKSAPEQSQQKIEENIQSNDKVNTDISDDSDDLSEEKTTGPRIPV